MIRRVLGLRVQQDRGFTLTETLVTISIMVIVPLTFGNALFRMQSDVSNAQGGSQRNDDIRLAVSEIDRQIRSGNVFYNPASESDAANGIVAGMSLRVYTQANAPTNNPGERCVQWRINDSGQLQTRWWQPRTTSTSFYSSTVTAWRTVAEDISNRTASPAVAAFTLDTTSGYGSRLIKIRMLTDRTDDGSGTPLEVDASVTGRNTQYGYPNNICDYP